MERAQKNKGKKRHNKNKNKFLVSALNQGSALSCQSKMPAESKDQDTEKEQLQPEWSAEQEPSAGTQFEEKEPQCVKEEACEPDNQEPPEPVNPWITKIFQEAGNQMCSLHFEEEEFPLPQRRVVKSGSINETTMPQTNMNITIQNIPEEPQQPSSSEEPQHPAASVKPRCPDKTPPQQLVKESGSELPPQLRPMINQLKTFPKMPVGLQISERDLQNLMGHKERANKLEKEKAALISEIEQLKDQLKSQTAEANQRVGVLLVDLSKKGAAEREAVSRAAGLEEALAAEEKKRMEAETSLRETNKETSTLKAALAQAKLDLENERHLWREAQAALLVQHAKDTAELKVNVLQMQEELEEERNLWQKEKANFLQCIAILKENQERKQQENLESGDILMGRLTQLEQQMETLRKKPKRRSLRKRFLQLFKRTRDSDPTPEL
ncbi:proteoglycan 4-like isoform X2 [Xyrichtys novacula]|uniref:Proteoglycan 4-like isoform X2 n=1 Tax=Xyrichtys novacula TaxID=13765 RepID=A0AAV1FF91_XYRNO|nr:proteoglycan 4-like isoform X2 [Xyrichtys novacula]